MNCSSTSGNQTCVQVTSVAAAQSMRSPSNSSPLKRSWTQLSSPPLDATTLDESPMSRRPSCVAPKFQDSGCPSPALLQSQESGSSVKAGSLACTGAGHPWLVGNSGQRQMLLRLESGQLPRNGSLSSPHDDVGQCHLTRLDSMSPSSATLWRTLPRASSISSPHAFSPHSPSPRRHSPSSPTPTQRYSARQASPRGLMASPGIVLARYPSKLGRESEEPAGAAAALVPSWSNITGVPAPSVAGQAVDAMTEHVLTRSASCTQPSSMSQLGKNQLHGTDSLRTSLVDEERREEGEDMEVEEDDGSSGEYTFKIELGSSVFPQSPGLTDTRAKVLGSRQGTPLRRHSGDFAEM